jgi:fused signal recognition particle receptor
VRFGIIKSIFQKVDSVITGRGRIDEDLFDDLEAALLQSDVNIHTTLAVLEDLRTSVRENRLKDAEDVKNRLKESLSNVFRSAEMPEGGIRFSDNPPTVILVVGVNGVGKTTSIAKMANRFKKEGRNSLLAAGDTFRAGAIEQLQIWGDRLGLDVIRHREGSDPSAVIFDALKAARARHADVVIADTAGRLHTRNNLMEELRKINRTLERELGRPADEILLVLDATTGQNAISQAREFVKATPLTGIILAKLDGTARGGIVITIVDEMKLPIKFIGTGEKLDDLEDFDPEEFVSALLEG